MTRRGAFFTLTLCLLAHSGALWAQQQPQSEWVVESLAPEKGGHADYDFRTSEWTATNNVVVTYGGGVLTAEWVKVNTQTGEVTADGRVPIQQGQQIWASDHIRYNF